MKKICLSFFYCCLIIFVSAQYTWVNKSLFPDSGFIGGASYVINGMGYIVGGLTNYNPDELSSHTWQYNPTTNVWTRKADYPYKTLGGAFFLINGIGYQIGGFDTTNTYNSDNYAYDPIANTWTPKATYPENGIGGGFYFAINGIGYVGAGIRNTNVHGVLTGYSYNPLSNSWSSIANYPGHPSIGMCTFVIDSFGYAGMGGDGNGDFYSDMYKYNPRTNSWSQIASFPGTARFIDRAAFVIKGKAFVGSGQKSLQAGGTYCFGDYYMYDPLTDTWASAPGLQGPPRYAANALSFGDSAFLVGGLNQDGDIFYRYVDEFKPAEMHCNKADTTYVHIVDTTHVSVTDTLYISVSVGISPNNTINSLLAYPNPAHTQLLINTGNYGTMAGYSLKIVNALGQTVFQNADNQQLFSVSVAGWAQGIYYLQVINAGSVIVAVKEIVIQ